HGIGRQRRICLAPDQAVKSLMRNKGERHCLMESQPLQNEDLRALIESTIEKLREQYPDFENSYDTYTQQYGNRVIAVNEPFKLNDTTDPVILILGRNCVIFYSDSKKELRGSEGRVELKVGTTCILGRRQPQDSKLIAWNMKGEVELGDYNSLAGIIPSRVHAAIVMLSENETYFTDLGSSSGTVLVGDSSKGGQFVKVYDSGTPGFSSVKIDRVNMSRKS
ncbi:MAG: hypothetical protein ACRECH_17880, partial [Nitrososphaerales archaeon]